jgi:hypothetical protein
MGPLNRAVESSTCDCSRTFVKSNGCSKTFETIPAMLPNAMSLAARTAAGTKSFGDVSIFVVGKWEMQGHCVQGAFHRKEGNYGTLLLWSGFKFDARGAAKIYAQPPCRALADQRSTFNSPLTFKSQPLYFTPGWSTISVSYQSHGSCCRIQTPRDILRLVT